MRNNILIKLEEISKSFERPEEWVNLQVANLKYKLGKKDQVTRMLNNTSQPSFSQLNIISELLSELANKEISMEDLIELENSTTVA